MSTTTDILANCVRLRRLIPFSRPMYDHLKLCQRELLAVRQARRFDDAALSDQIRALLAARRKRLH